MWMSPQKDRFGKGFFFNIYINKNCLFWDYIKGAFFCVGAAGDQMLTQGVSPAALQLVFCNRVSH